MEPSTIQMSASVAAIPIVMTILRPICRVLFRERPARQSCRCQRPETLPNAGCAGKYVFFGE
jgi:hypothetical protein